MSEGPAKEYTGSDGWRDAKTDQPKRDGWYLVHVPTGRMGQPAVLMAWWAAGEGWKGIPHVWSDAVAHWMKMPAPPVA